MNYDDTNFRGSTGEDNLMLATSSSPHSDMTADSRAQVRIALLSWGSETDHLNGRERSNTPVLEDLGVAPANELPVNTLTVGKSESV